MKAVILASMMALTALAGTVPTRSANAAGCPGNPVHCTFSMGPIGPTSLCLPYICPDPPENDPFKIAGSWVVRREGQPFSNPDSTMAIDVWGEQILVRGAGWNGQGTFNGWSGQYAWSFANGYTGVTTFSKNFGDDTLHLQARGWNGLAWDWMASRQ
jgi:hypothetical protein